MLPTRVDITPAAAALVEKLAGLHGPLLFHQSGGCCDGSAPMCFPRREFRVGADPSAVTVGEDGIWVANRGDDTVTRIDAGSFNRETLAVGRLPSGVGVGGNAVWVANRVANTVTRLDPRTGERVGRSVAVPGTRPQDEIGFVHTR